MRVSLPEVQGWLEPTKLQLTSLNTGLLNNLETEVLARIGSVYDTSTWTDQANTPPLVRTIISKIYASFEIDKAYSENQDEGNDYARRLADNAEMLIKGLIDGDVDIPGVDPGNPTSASFFPTNASSAKKPTFQHPEYGGPYFTLGRNF